MDNPETLATLYIRHRTKTNKTKPKQKQKKTQKAKQMTKTDPTKRTGGGPKCLRIQNSVFIIIVY